jgi:hypothetical protein
MRYFETRNEAIEEVRTALGEWWADFDLDAIVDDLFEVDDRGRYYWEDPTDTDRWAAAVAAADRGGDR